MDNENKEGLGQMVPQKESGIGALIGTILIIVILLAGAFYFWYQNRQTLETLGTPEAITAGESASTDNPPLSESDDADSIERDLNNTTIEGSASIEGEIAE